MSQTFKDPVRNINQEYLQGLEVLSNKEFPLPGARCKGGDKDPRFSHLESGTGEMVFFNHLATVRHKTSNMIFVAFQQTMDALHLEQQDLIRYPKWLMDSQEKGTELSIYIHSIKPPYNINPGKVMTDDSIITPTAQTRTGKWLQEIKEAWVFDTVAYFLLNNAIITPEMYRKF
jgi:hypothetical protein